MECSAKRATMCAGRLTDIHRDEALLCLRTPPPRPCTSIFSAAPGERRKRTMTFIFAEPLRLAERRALSLSFPGFHRVALPALAETETSPSNTPQARWRHRRLYRVIIGIPTLGVRT